MLIEKIRKGSRKKSEDKGRERRKWRAEKHLNSCYFKWTPIFSIDLKVQLWYMYMYGWVLLLSTWNYHLIANWLILQYKVNFFFFFTKSNFRFPLWTSHFVIGWSLSSVSLWQISSYFEEKNGLQGIISYYTEIHHKGIMQRKWVWTGSLSSLWLPTVGKENNSIINVILLSCYD